MSEHRTVRVPLGERSYDVLVGDGVLSAHADRLTAHGPNGRAIVVADKAALAHHEAVLTRALDTAGLTPELIVLEGGERAKTWDGLIALTDQLLALNMERGESVMAFGGGTIGDLVGFASAITKRGTGFVQIPTTLLAQVDSSVGGKTGINTPAGKNLVGAFHQPGLVIADTSLLMTLPVRELRAGYAEILKAGLIGDAEFFARLEAAGTHGLSGTGLIDAVADAVAFKARIVAEDEREGGLRALLNLGHTFGHAFEAEAAKGTLIHGEAVAVGMALAYDYSARLGVCAPEDAARARAAIGAAGLPTRPSHLPGGPYGAEALVARMVSDKKNTGGAITLILARGIGQAYIAPNADRCDLTEFLKEELKRQ
jgi:3-dehydroquinate synthase